RFWRLNMADETAATIEQLESEFPGESEFVLDCVKGKLSLHSAAVLFKDVLVERNKALAAENQKLKAISVKKPGVAPLESAGMRRGAGGHAGWPGARHDRDSRRPGESFAQPQRLPDRASGFRSDAGAAGRGQPICADEVLVVVPRFVGPAQLLRPAARLYPRRRR